MDLSMIVGSALLVLTCVMFGCAVAIPRDDGARLYRRETVGFCAMGLASLCRTGFLVKDWSDVMGMSMPVLAFVVIGLRLFIQARRHATAAAGS